MLLGPDCGDEPLCSQTSGAKRARRRARTAFHRMSRRACVARPRWPERPASTREVEDHFSASPYAFTLGPSDSDLMVAAGGPQGTLDPASTDHVRVSCARRLERDAPDSKASP